MSNQAPAYQMYAGDWLKSRSVRLMTDYQRGWYIQLLNEAWDGKPQCMLPNDTKALQILAGISELARHQDDFNERWADVQRMFNGEGKYVYNERQLEELAKQKQRSAQNSKAGSESAKKRERDREELKALQAQYVAESNGCSTSVQQAFNPSSSSSSSSPSPPPKEEDIDTDTDTDARAYALHDALHGALHGGNGELPKPKPKPTPYTAEFEDFWSCYPNKTAKRTAFEAFKQAKKRTTIATMIAAVKKQSEWPKWKEASGSFVPNPSTWLNGDRWEDVSGMERQPGESDDHHFARTVLKVY